MVSPQPALRQSRAPHIHIAGERCPVCDQPIPNEKAEEVRARLEALAEAANTRAAQQIAQEKAQIEANAHAAVEQIRKESAHALQKAQGEMAAKEAAAHAAGKQEADAALKERLAAAEQAKTALEAAGQQRDADWQKRLPPPSAISRRQLSNSSP